MTKKFPCPCCGFLTFIEIPYDTFYICPVCGWEDDGAQIDDPDYKWGANNISLNEAKIKFLDKGYIKESSIKYLRKPLEDELPN